MVTLGELVDYVLKNRKGNAFRNYDEHTIASGIKRAADSRTLLYSCRDDGSLCGIIVCVEDESAKTMNVQDLLTTERWVLPKFVLYFREHFPGYKLAALRRDKPVIYNKTPELCNKLMKGTI